MSHSVFRASLVRGAALLAAFYGCYTGPSAELPTRAHDDATSADAGSTEGGEGTGLPCDVEALMARCRTCHSDPPTTAPMALVTYAQLTARSGSDPSSTMAQAALARMRDPQRPMPPSNPLPESELSAFASWVAAGTPATSCAADEVPVSSHDGGGPECVLASDCPGELICRSGVCDVECVTDKDCAPTWGCKSTRCRPPAASANDAGTGPSGATSRDIASAASWSLAELGSFPPGSYNGTAFDGRFVYFTPDGTSGRVMRFDTEQPFGSVDAWSVFDLASIDARAIGYRGAVFDGRYLYLVPTSGPGLLVARFDTQARFTSADAWSFSSLKEQSASVSGFTGGTFDGRYVYFVPAFGKGAVAARFDTRAPLSSPAAWSTFSVASLGAKATSFAGAVFDGHYVYLVPWRSGDVGGSVVARYDLQGGFGDPASWKVLDLTTLNASASGYHAAAFDGRYVYLVPGWTAPTPAWSSSTLARFDTQASFDAASAWSFFDMTTLGPEAGGFNAAVFDGRYLVFAPGYGAAKYRSNVYRFDTRSSVLGQTSAWSRFDASELASTFINSKGAAFDGRYVYLAPAGGVAARFDARTPRAMPELPGFKGSFY